MMEELDTVLRWIDTLGTLGAVVTALWFIYTGRVRFKADFESAETRHREALAEQDRQHKEDLAYVEARRVEERAGRIAAEKRVSAFAEAFDEVLTVMRGIKEEVIRNGGRR